jgi:hypothetical protein
MKQVVVAILLMCAFTCAGHAQERTKEETLALVSERMASIQKDSSTFQQTYANYDTGTITRKLNEIVKMVSDLRDELSGNPYVRVSSFNVGLPFGVSVEFSFPPPEKKP